MYKNSINLLDEPAVNQSQELAVISDIKTTFVSSILDTEYEIFLSSLHQLTVKSIFKAYAMNPHFYQADSETKKTPWHLVDVHDTKVVEAFAQLIPARINEYDAEGYTPLHLAARLGNLKKCETLIALGADPTLYAADGNTYLHLAAKHLQLDIIQHFYSSRSNNLLNRNGLSLLDVCLLHNPLLGIISNFLGNGVKLESLLTKNFDLLNSRPSYDRTQKSHSDKVNREKAIEAAYDSIDIYHFFEFEQAFLSRLDKELIGYVSWFDSENNEYLYYKKDKSMQWCAVPIHEKGSLKIFYRIFDAYQQ